MSDNNGQIPLDAIARAPVQPPPEVNGNNIGDPLTGRTDPDLRHKLGCIGQFVGGGSEKAGNVAMVVILLSFVILGVAIWISCTSTVDGAVQTAGTVITAAWSAITGSVGFLFGNQQKDK